MSVTSSTSESAADRVTSPVPNLSTSSAPSAPGAPLQTPNSAAPVKKKVGVKRKLADTTTPPAAPYDSGQEETNRRESSRQVKKVTKDMGGGTKINVFW